MRRGRKAFSGSSGEQITIANAAQLIGMSRLSLSKLIETGVLRSRTVRKQECLLLQDVLAYARTRDSERRAALNRLSRAAVKAGLYDRNTFPHGGQDE